MEKGSRLTREIWAVLVLVTGLLLLMSLLSYDPTDWSFSAPSGSARTHNWAGVVGAHLADVFLQSFGLLAYVSPFFLFIIAYQLFRDQEAGLGLASCIGYALLLWSATILTSLLVPEADLDRQSGGIVGGLSRYLLAHLFGLVGSYLISLSMLTLGVMLAAKISLEDLFQRLIAKRAKAQPDEDNAWARAEMIEVQKIRSERPRADQQPEPVQQRLEFVDKDLK